MEVPPLLEKEKSLVSKTYNQLAPNDTPKLKKEKQYAQEGEGLP
ncbi:hypothetical protein [Sharpea azabuensis]|nr:hypothetical protein [Sharpea azabuensis]